MKYFGEFSEERQREIVEEYANFFKEELLLLDKERIQNEIEERLFDFRTRWDFNETWINYEIKDKEKIIYTAESFRWGKEEVCQLITKIGEVNNQKQIKDDINWFEKIGGMDFFIDVGMYSNVFEITPSHRFVLTQTLLVDEKAQRTTLLMYEFEEDEETTKSLQMIANTKSSSKERKKMDNLLDEIFKNYFYEKRKKWSSKLEIKLEEDFAKVKSENLSSVAHYESAEYIIKRLKEKNLIYFTDKGMPLKENRK